MAINDLFRVRFWHRAAYQPDSVDADRSRLAGPLPLPPRRADELAWTRYRAGLDRRGAVAWRVLGRRLGGLAGGQIGRSLVRMHVAALPAAIFALAVAVVVTLALPTGRPGAFLIVVVGGAGALLCYLAAARALRLQEVTDLAAMARSRLRP
jgi:hypothetical protein